MFKEISNFNKKIINYLLYINNRIIFFLLFCLIISFSIKFFAEEIFLTINKHSKNIKILIISNKIYPEIEKILKEDQNTNDYKYRIVSFESSKKQNYVNKADIIIDLENTETLEIMDDNFNLRNLSICNLDLESLSLSKTNTILTTNYNNSQVKIGINKLTFKIQKDCKILKDIISKLKIIKYPILNN